MIRLVVFDIDGVLTDGSILVDCQGNEQKRINIKDIDAVYELKRRGFQLAAITGENSPIVSYFEQRFPWDYFFCGCKKKADILSQLMRDLKLDKESVAYIGDGKYDVDVLPCAGLSFCPSDAVREAQLVSNVILSRKGGEGCVWEMVDFLMTYNAPHSKQRFFLDRLEEHRLLFHRMAADVSLMEHMLTLADQTVSRIQKGGQIFFCGNGGSAADAQHIATEFIGRFYQDRAALNAEALSVNTSTLTAIGNDYGFERVFVRQLEAKARPNDVVVGLSTSGKSSNILQALQYAKENGMLSVAFTGLDEPRELLEAAQLIIHAPSRITPRIQECHIFLGHLLAEYVEAKLFPPKKENLL
nr:SIS domain-containing protein [uncultured Agathobaculum sp.]